MIKMKNIAQIVIATGIAFSLSACDTYEQYHFDEKIGNEHVVFSESRFGGINYIDVTEESGRKIRYVDSQMDNLKLNEVYVDFDGNNEDHIMSNAGNFDQYRAKWNGYKAAIERINKIK